MQDLVALLKDKRTLLATAAGCLLGALLGVIAFYQGWLG